MQDLMYVILFIIFAYPIRIQAAGVFYANEYELYGPTLAANDQWIIVIQNRTGITFSAVSNYFSSPQFCSVTYLFGSLCNDVRSWSNRVTSEQ